ncbi:hypothetical protein DICPUDRAFT_146707 [Dictyostelium purpureum]|uniref:Uncharacterized protein n=1 Tax=Dictyostelium purpureum TaxID=5786 RepID=F0Z6T7_DICPU|nr:uncharacterized protein DICPUDRAFT_146707 [Dictyostelium purpureum]EGC40319.1 hypothetical protein DICPUDRAFT_146707 [Dictyostelium purpureum]|eukprot:XP_003283070.1 hypothetical protein DICPUDRAFT_146707 [Dictyostelium purpureum]
MKNQTTSNGQMAQNKVEHKTHFDEKNLIITYETYSSFGCIKGDDYKLHSPHFKMQLSESEFIKDILNGESKERCMFVNGITFDIKEENIDRKNFTFWCKSDDDSSTLYVISNANQDCIFIVCDDYKKTNESYEKFIRIGKKFIEDLEKMV